MECIICFSPITSVHQCSDSRCKESFCRECVVALIDFCVDEKTMPKCLSRNCDSYIILSDLNGIGSENLKTYYKACMNYFLQTNGDEIKTQMQEKILMDKFRKDQQKFIQEKFPAAISLIANIAFQPKLKKLEKYKTELVKKQLQSNHRGCMNITCSGILNENLQCLNCHSRFCPKCELILNEKHECKQKDVDSVSLISSLCKCPGCATRVFKNEGCDNITCSNCNTNFKYSTGEIGGSGSHNTKIIVNINQKHKLSIDYKNIIPTNCLEKLLEIESLEPHIISKDTMLLPIKKYIETKDERQFKQLAIRIDAYYNNCFKIRDYQMYMVQLENLLKSNIKKFSKKLDKILEYLKD